MPPAVIAAGVVAAGTIGGAVLSSSAQKKAASQANNTQQDATAAQLQLGQQSLDLNKQIYNSNYGLLSPFVSNGLAASNNLNALLGLPAGPKLTSPLAAPPVSSGGATPAPAQSGYTGPSLVQIMAMKNDGIPHNYEQAMGQYNAYQASHPGASMTPTVAHAATTAQPAAQAAQAAPGASAGPRPKLSDYRGDSAGWRAAMDAWRAHQAPAAGGGGAAGGAGGASSATNALNQFANSAGMKFQLAQGADMLNNLYAARGMIQSGAAMKGIQDYGQQTALNNYFMPYMGLLQGQQNMGAQAGAAVAGVGSNFGNTAANIYNGMGSSLQNGANSASNAAIMRGLAGANLGAGIASGFGQLGSALMPQSAFGSSYSMPVSVAGQVPRSSLGGAFY